MQKRILSDSFSMLVGRFSWFSEMQSTKQIVRAEINFCSELIQSRVCVGSHFFNADFLVFVPSSSYLRAKIIVLDVNL